MAKIDNCKNCTPDENNVHEPGCPCTSGVCCQWSVDEDKEYTIVLTAGEVEYLRGDYNDVEVVIEQILDQVEKQKGG